MVAVHRRIWIVAERHHINPGSDIPRVRASVQCVRQLVRRSRLGTVTWDVDVPCAKASTECQRSRPSRHGLSPSVCLIVSSLICLRSSQLAGFQRCAGMDAAPEVVTLLDDCCHRAVFKSTVVGATVILHRDPSTQEAQVAGPTVTIAVEMDPAINRLIVSAELSSVEHSFLDFVFQPVHKLREKGFTGPPQNLTSQFGVRFETKAQNRTASGNRPRSNRQNRDPTNRRYVPPAPPAPPVLLLPRGQMRPRKLIQKKSRARTQAREEPIPVYIPEMESSSEASSEPETN